MTLLKTVAVMVVINSGAFIAGSIFFMPELYESVKLELWGALISSMIIAKD